MNEVYAFDKSLQERLLEYKHVLSGFEILPASGLLQEWGFYLELTIDPNGWQAVWKISRATCNSLNIPFPTIILVFVLNVDYPSLQAMVRVIAVQDDIHLPEKHCVPLIQLWPTKTQDKSVALNLISTANGIDMLRFFYIHLFMPWDLEDEETTDWKTKHLESRLRLYYDMKNGVIPKATAERINSLMTEARRLQNKKESVEIEVEQNEVEGDCNQEYMDILSNIHLSLLEIKSEVEILENPVLRKAFLLRQNRNSLVDVSNEPSVWLIHEESTLDKYISFLEGVKVLHPSDKVIVQPNLSLTMEKGGPSDTYILSEGKYELNIVGELGNGGILKGIGDKENVIIISSLEDIMFDFQVGQCLMENVTIDAIRSQYGMVIRKGKVTLSKCKLFGDATSTTCHGIILLAGSELELIDCEISGFGTAIVGNSSSKITMRNTEIYNVHFGLKAFDNSYLTVEKCVFRDCKDYGVCVETKNNLNGSTRRVGDFDMLNIIPEVNTECVKGMNNFKGDAVINQASQINAVEDLFSVKDPTISEGPSEEEMVTEDENQEDNLEQTVIENMRNVSPVTI